MPSDRRPNREACRKPQRHVLRAAFMLACEHRKLIPMGGARKRESSKAAALRVAQATFEGLAPLLIRCGITSPEVEALLRAVCVHTAAKNQEQVGRPNVSRVSIKTGVDRHTVAALLMEPPNIGTDVTSRRDAISRVIDGWSSDPEYSERGAPRDLDIGDPNSKGRTAWTLVQRYAPGVWPRLIVGELIRLDYVDTLPNGQLRWKRTPNFKLASRRSTHESSNQLMRDAVQALFQYAIRPDGRSTWRTAQSLEISEQDLPLVRKMLRERLNTMFAWLTDELNSARWQQHGSRPNARIRVGLTGFTFEEPLTTDRVNEKVKKPRRTKT
jgi:Family of unknown function (DUF6502)